MQRTTVFPQKYSLAPRSADPDGRRHGDLRRRRMGRAGARNIIRSRISICRWGRCFTTRCFPGIRGLVAYFFRSVLPSSWAMPRPNPSRPSGSLFPRSIFLQSIPVLGFLPGLVLALGRAFSAYQYGTGARGDPGDLHRPGLEHDLQLLFVAQVRPSDLSEASTVIGLSWWQRLVNVELPFSAVNLAWNSLMSMAGGWFFLNVCEASNIGDHEYRLPGVGPIWRWPSTRDDHRRWSRRAGDGRPDRRDGFRDLAAGALLGPVISGSKSRGRDGH